MSWLSSLRGAGSRKEPAAKGPGSQTLTAEDAPEIHRSLALPAVFAALARGHKLNVLDLGAALGSNVERLAEYGCRLDIEDLYASKSAPEGGGGLGPDFFADFLASAEGRQFDLVLAWDLFNYLDRKELGDLGRRLRLCCRPGALIFALVSYHKMIPAQPIRFRFIDQDQDQLIYERRTAVERPGPRFVPAELNALLGGFQVDRSFLLRHGIQEYLFLREGP